MSDPKTIPSNFWRKWLKRIGIVGFLFFLIKGIIWLVLGYLILR